jgi:hypothetical protein
LAHTAATAAKDSAEAAKTSVEAVISKERARISIEKPEALKLKDDPFTRIKFKVHVFAPTPAVIIESTAYADVTDSTTPPSEVWHHPVVFAPNETRADAVLEKDTWLLHKVDDAFRQKLYEERTFFHFRVTIRYRDVFQSMSDEPHETRIGYLWVVGTDVQNRVPRPGSTERWFSGWEENPPGYNRET